LECSIGWARQFLSGLFLGCGFQKEHMNQELTKKLYDEFPELYRGRNKPTTETAMCFGFDCNDGWFQIIYDLSADLMKLSGQAGLNRRK